MLVVHKIELKPNNKQATYFAKSCGVARFAYNWALTAWQEKYAKQEKVSEVSLRRELNQIKHEEFPWMQEVTKVAPQQAIKNLGTAFKRFFNKQGKYPRYKKKGIHDSFRADNGPDKVGGNAVEIIGKEIKLPKIGLVRMKEALRFTGQIKSVTISRRATKWYAAISVEILKLPNKRKNQGLIGVDLGVKTLATLSDKTKITGPRSYLSLLKKTRRLSKQVSRKEKASKNHHKAKIKLAANHAKIVNIRKDAIHKLTTNLVVNHTVIGIEDLNVSGLVKNKKLSKHIMDGSFYEIRRQLEYKSKWYGSQLIIADRFFPSSKTCNICGEINNNLVLSDRDWQCICGANHDRDINAAKNLALFAANTVSSTGIYAY